MDKPPLRILEVLAGGEHGGAETAFVDTVIALHEAGQIVEVATRANDIRVPALKEAGLTVHTLPFGGALDVYTSYKLKKIVKAFRPQIVQTWMSRASHKMPAWNASMGIPRYLNVARLGGYYKIKYFAGTDYFNTITPDIKRHLVDRGVPEADVQHINNFAETEAVFEAVSRADLGTPEDATLLLGLGRLHTAKAFDTLIKVVAGLPDVHLWIAGEGPQRAELEALIADLKVGDRVKLLGWRNDRAALLQACDICCFTSRYEPFGTVFVQAWAQKTPVIVSDADGPRQFVRDGEDGLVVAADDEAALAGAIQKLVDDLELQGKLLTNGFARYEDEFTKQKTIEAYLAWFHAILGQETLLNQKVNKN